MCEEPCTALGSLGRKCLVEGRAVESTRNQNERGAGLPGAWGSGPGQNIILDQQEKQK